jgi:anti-sigma B factor antagonist
VLTSRPIIAVKKKRGKTQLQTVQIHIWSRQTMEIRTEKRERGAIVHAAGRIDTAAAPGLEQEINRLISEGMRRVLLDFTGVPYISSGGLRVLLVTAKKLRGPDDSFALCALNPEVTKIMTLAGFTTIFTIYPSEGEALARW